jgi:hypothetical protein
MPTIIARHKVGDIDKWLRGHQDRVKIFEPYITGFKTYQDMDDPKSVVLVIETNDVEKLGAVMNDPAHAETKARHTVIEPITISMPVAL